MDKTSLNLISIVLGGVGLFVVLTKFSVPELHATFLGSNPFAAKRDIIESVMTWLFTGLTLLGLLVQVGVAIWGNHLAERIHTTQFYVVLFVLMLAFGVALVPVLTSVGNRVARRAWLPQVVENQKEVYKAASFIIEHDGWREDQLVTKDTLPDPERYRTANLDTATRQVEQIEKLLELAPCSADLRARLNAIKPFFERR
ncbi:MAG TPA: hypothetical protein VNN10_08065 [Dehalococcoidia bacterium]|nr:hypothetical protein [Dehalococcoidia bacterium]